MPSSARRRQPPPPARQSVLSIPQAEAEDELTSRIAAGHQLIDDIPILPPSRHASSPWETQPSRTEGLDEVARQVEQWRDYNGSWLSSTLGGEAAEEYTKASIHPYGYGWSDTPEENRRHLISHIETEISKLESIRGRLSIWAPEPHSVTSSRISQASPDAPIFIVHGRDTGSAESVAYVVGTATGRKTVILRDEANLGQTLIEKFEKHATEASYAVIILTPDDHGGLAGETGTRPRGRQNVIFEMGYFYGRIGRRYVSVLIRPGVEKPSDMDGIAYITFDDSRAWKTELLRELKHAGIDVEL